jgi:hypothetical protein
MTLFSFRLRAPGCFEDVAHLTGHAAMLALSFAFDEFPQFRIDGH